MYPLPLIVSVGGRILRILTQFWMSVICCHIHWTCIRSFDRKSFGAHNSFEKIPLDYTLKYFKYTILSYIINPFSLKQTKGTKASKEDQSTRNKGAIETTLTKQLWSYCCWHDVFCIIIIFIIIIIITIIFFHGWSIQFANKFNKFDPSIANLSRNIHQPFHHPYQH